MNMNLFKTTTLALALATLTIVGAQSADALKMYRDMETGGLYTAPGEGREEFKPFGLDIGFTFFLQYRSELAKRDQPINTTYAAKNTTTAPYDAFEATRTVVDIRRSFSKTARARLVLDNRGAANDYRVYVRHVIGELDIPSVSSTLSFGEIATPTISYDDSFWGYRVQGTSFMEREGLLTSGDWGIGWNWKPTSFPIEWYTTFTNGQGRTTAEVNIGKSLESRISWKTPIDGLTLSGFGYHSQGGSLNVTANNGAEVRQERFGGGIYYRQPFWRIAVTGVVARDLADTYGNARMMLSSSTDNMNRQSVPSTNASTLINQMNSKGYSVMGVVDIPGSEWSVLGRFDYFRPGGEIDDNGHHRYIFGPSYRYNDNMTFLLTYEKLEFERAALTASGNVTGNAYEQQRLLLQAQIVY